MDPDMVLCSSLGWDDFLALGGRDSHSVHLLLKQPLYCLFSGKAGLLWAPVPTVLATPLPRGLLWKQSYSLGSAGSCPFDPREERGFLQRAPCQATYSPTVCLLVPSTAKGHQKTLFRDEVKPET